MKISKWLLSKNDDGEQFVFGIEDHKITNKNIVKKNSDNSNGVDYNELDQFMNLVTDKAQYHTTRLINYLVQNVGSFPLYNNPGNGYDVIFPKGVAYDCGIFLGNAIKTESYEEKFERYNTRK